MKYTLALPAALALVLAPQVHAQDLPDGVKIGGDRVTIGVGPAAIPSYDGSDDTVVVPSVAVQGQVSGIAFGLQGTTAWADLIPDKGKPGWKLQAGPQFTLRLDRNSLVRDSAVKALGSLDKAWEVGAWAGVQRTGVVTSPYDTFSASVAYAADIGGAHKSYVVSPSLAYSTPLSTKTYASLTLGADYVGKGFGAYYYDISPAGSAASSLSVYDDAGHSGWKDYNGQLLLDHSLTGNLTHGLSVFVDGGYSRLLGRYARSPVVADVGTPNQWAGAAGLAFTF
jgi:outer membrane protein